MHCDQRTNRVSCYHLKLLLIFTLNAPRAKLCQQKKRKRRKESIVIQQHTLTVPYAVNNIFTLLYIAFHQVV